MKTIFNNKPVLAFFFLIIAGLEPVIAQSPTVIKLGDAIEMSLTNSKQLKLSQTNVELAGLSIKEIKDNQLPSLGVSASYLRLNSPNVTLKLGGTSNDSTGSKGTPSINQAMYGMVSASMPLFSGFRFKYGIESAKYLEQASKIDVETNKDAVIINTIAAYTNLYKAQRAVDLVAENLKSEQDRVLKFTDREQNGLLARNDLMKAKLQESNIELALLDAENDLKVTRVNMNLILGLPKNSMIEASSDSFESLMEEGDVASWELKAIENRKDLAANLIRQKSANIDIKVAKADLYPSVALTAGYVALGVPGVITVPNAMNAGIGVKYNIASLWKSSTKINQVRMHAYQLKTNEAILEDKIHLEVTTAYYNYVLTKRKIEVYAKAVEQSEENFRITKNKFDNSLVNTTELLDADVAQVQSKINFETSKADALMAYKKLEHAAGIVQ